VAPHLTEFSEFASAPIRTGTLPLGTIVANSRFAPALDALLNETRVWRADGRVVAVRLAAPMEASAFAHGAVSLDALASEPGETLAGWWMHDVWDLIRHLPAMLAADAPALGEHAPPPPAELTVLGEHPALVMRGAYIEPFVIADTTLGPVLVEAGARVNAFTRLVGPCIIGADAQISGGRVATCAIGEQARIHGEISSTIVIGHANKAHDGFVGHSIIGRWANLGAGTITSNLKNNYGTVNLWTPHGLRDTGLQFLGTMLGDHAKTGIGTRLTTGSVIGAGANVFGSVMLPKMVPAFAWGSGEPFGTFALERFLAVAERVMARREVALSPEMRATLTAAYGLRDTPAA
jgi:UDP-N-acetylglucosamine diphosphorylase/glucosamine-1-phosphate N-acetyltransferase